MSLQITVDASSAINAIEQLRERIKGASYRVALGATASYAGFQEYGTRRMSAHPYLRPAMFA